MAAAWFVLIAFMLTVYVVLDGFDFGAGIVHHVIARTDRERRTVLAAIGPVWDGNEVWLVAAGGTLVFAFPRVYAVAFSGFYLPLMLVLWLLVLRGISIEFRSHHASVLWREFWDALFTFSSILLAFVFGASLGNVLRGVPLDGSGWFGMSFFTDFSARGAALGALDWYTVLVGLFAVMVLGAHGALYLRWKSDGAVNERAARVAYRLWLPVGLVGVGVTVATAVVQPSWFERLGHRPWLWWLPVGAGLSWAAVLWSLRRGRERFGFLGSAAFIVFLLAATAGVLFPTLVASTIQAEYSLTAYNASAGQYSLLIGLCWWIPAVLLAIGYFVFLFRSFRGKVEPGEGDGGY